MTEPHWQNHPRHARPFVVATAMVSKTIIPQSVFALAVVFFTLVLRPSSVLESFYTSSPFSKAVRPISPIGQLTQLIGSHLHLMYTKGLLQSSYRQRRSNLEVSYGKRLLSARCLPNWTFSLKIIQHGLYVLAFIDSDCCQERPEVVTLDGAPISPKHVRELITSIAPTCLFLFGRLCKTKRSVHVHDSLVWVLLRLGKSTLTRCKSSFTKDG
jgi:hypothetical protein